MRTKQEILHNSYKSQAKTLDWYTAASLHQRLTIEVLCDIRDEFMAVRTQLQISNTTPKQKH